MLKKIKVMYLIVTSICCMAITSIAWPAEEDSLAKVLSNPDKAERCVHLHQIDRTDIIDDGIILFYMRGKKVYLNKLPHSCHGLKAADAFMYRTSLSRLCNVDIITVLNSMGGGFTPGPACGLGLFYPIDKETAKQISKRSR